MEHIAPTLERARHAGDTWEPLHHDKRAGTVKPARELSVFEMYYMGGHITEVQKDAGVKYEITRELASRATVTQSYGMQRFEGTPVSQMADDVVAMKTDSYGAHMAAVRAIGGRHCEVLEQAISRVPLHVIGRSERDKSKHRSSRAIRRARVRIMLALEELITHYGMRPKPK